MDGWQLLLELIGIAVCDKAPTEALRQACTPEALEGAYKLAVTHDLAHLAGQGAAKLQLPDSQPLEKCRRAAMQAFQRYTRQEMALQSACKLLEEGQLPFIPLKGAVLRRHYPAAWLRNSCDIDILVEETRLGQARQLLEEAGWKYAGSSSHDISLFSPEGIHLELHHTTLEDCYSAAGAAVMDRIWENARPASGKLYQMELSDGLFYFYHIAHMAKHFLDGGCGIRPFLDIWILNHRVQPDENARKALLEQGQLTGFAQGAEKLSRIWFEGESMDEHSKSFETFVLNGGTYGNLENQVNLRQAKRGSKLRFLWTRIFPPYGILKYSYPVLQKCKWLTPIFWVIRWFRLLRGGKLTQSVQELKTAGDVTADTQTAANALLTYLEL